MTLKKNDFIEIEFTGKVKQGEVFDSNVKEQIKKTGANTPAKPFIFPLGQGMFLKAIDEFLIGKKEKQKYSVELSAEQAFGKRNPQAIRLIPLAVFKQHKINPYPGAVFNFDGKIAKVLSVSGGRIMVDFNHPLSGKDVNYDINVLRKVTDINEQINAISDFLFKKQFKFEIKQKKLIFSVEKQMVKFVELFKQKFKDIFDLELEVKEISDSTK